MYTIQTKKYLNKVSILFMLSFLVACGDDQKNTTSDANLISEENIESNVESNIDSETEVNPDSEMEPEPEPEPEADPVPALEDRLGLAGIELFGAPLAENIEFVLFEDLIADPFTYADRTIQTEGTVRQNCQKRGCWMEIRSLTDPTSEGVTVRFLDYGFFVPLDSRGSSARIEGITEVQTLSADQVEELIAEGYDPGIVAEDGTATLINFTASGVLMWDRNEE